MIEVSKVEQATRIIESAIQRNEDSGNMRLTIPAWEIEQQMNEAENKVVVKRGFTVWGKRKAKREKANAEQEKSQAMQENKQAVLEAFKLMFKNDERVTVADDKWLVVHHIGDVEPIRGESLVKARALNGDNLPQRRKAPAREEFAKNVVYSRINRIMYRGIAIENRERLTISLSTLMNCLVEQTQMQFTNDVIYGGRLMSAGLKETYTPFVQKAMAEYAKDVEAPLTATLENDVLTLVLA